MNATATATIANRTPTKIATMANGLVPDRFVSMYTHGG